MTTENHSVARQLSWPLIVLAAAFVVVGLISGWFQYLDRSHVREKPVAGAAAWGQQIVLAVVVAVILGYAWRRHRRRFGPDSGRLWLLAPLGRVAARRATRTVLGVRGPAGFGRVLLALLPAFVFFYSFWRIGLQVTGGLDPNSTVNAWGGPTYIGAMACHYLDSGVLIAVAAWLLDRILVPDPAIARAGGVPT
jgi:hypothetical protein